MYEDLKKNIFFDRQQRIYKPEGWHKVIGVSGQSTLIKSAILDTTSFDVRHTVLVKAKEREIHSGSQQL